MISKCITGPVPQSTASTSFYRQDSTLAALNTALRSIQSDPKLASVGISPLDRGYFTPSSCTFCNAKSRNL
jgi:hypothetical protein